MFGLLGSLFTFAFALLTRGDDEEPAGVQSRPAWLFFSATLGILIVLALVVPQLLGSSWMWRLRKDGLRGSLHAHCFGLLAPHEPIKFDMEDLATKAEALFDQIDTDRNHHLSSDELKKAVIRQAADRGLTLLSRLRLCSRVRCGVCSLRQVMALPMGLAFVSLALRPPAKH